MRRVESSRFGAPQVLEIVRHDDPVPSACEVLIRQQAIGVNFIDILLRRGDLGGTPPVRPGLEAAGVVLAVGSGVTGLATGDRVAYAGGASGAYADVRTVDASRVVALPPHVSTTDAAAVFFKALTADYLVHRLRPLHEGDVVLFHGAAGGVGTLAIPMLRSRGIRVIGSVGKAAKVPYALALGCEAVAVIGSDDVAQLVKDRTAGRGVAVAYDPIGRATIDSSFASLARFGLLVSYGWASGDADPVPWARLRERGSVFITRPTVSHYTDDRKDLEAAAARVFDALAEGVIAPRIHATYPLADVARAHEDMEAGRHMGSLILAP